MEAELGNQADHIVRLEEEKGDLGVQLAAATKVKANAIFQYYPGYLCLHLNHSDHPFSRPSSANVWGSSSPGELL